MQTSERTQVYKPITRVTVNESAQSVARFEAMLSRLQREIRDGTRDRKVRELVALCQRHV
jgi:hypothetical protein